MALDGLNALLAGGVFSILLVFCRIGAAFMLLPGFGDTNTPARVRLFLAIGFSLVLAPGLHARLPALPGNPTELAVLLGVETMTGLFLGTVARILVNSLETGGMIIAQQIGLSSVLAFNPQLATQTSLPGSLLSLAAVLVIFSTGLDHMLIRALVASYDAFPVGPHLPTGDMSEVIARAVAHSFLIGVEIAAPFLVAGLLLFMALGLLSRLLPQVQIFFISLPLQVGLGLAIFAAVIPAILLFWVQRFDDGVTSLFTTGN
jgi:flagellar biosynthetic protein FliR